MHIGGTKHNSTLETNTAVAGQPVYYGILNSCEISTAVVLYSVLYSARILSQTWFVTTSSLTQFVVRCVPCVLVITPACLHAFVGLFGIHYFTTFSPVAATSFPAGRVFYCRRTTTMVRALCAGGWRPPCDTTQNAALSLTHVVCRWFV